MYNNIDIIYPIIAYFLGSVPFGLVFSNLFGKGNLRKSGSKNIGATNVFRTQGNILGVLTFFLDFAKGFVACHCFQTENEIINLAVIAAPVIGHIFPVWLRFKGGKGIATYFGVLCALNAYTFLGSIGIWAMVCALSKISSISGITSVISSCLIFSYVKYIFHLEFINQLYVLIFLVVIIVAKHHENIKRLLNNDELKA